MEEQIELKVSFELGEKGGTLEFTDPSAVLRWFDEEKLKWQWMSQIKETSGALAAFESLRQEANQYVQQWMQNPTDAEVTRKTIVSLKQHFESSIHNQSLWLSSSPTGDFILKLQKNRHDLVAAGAYIALGGSYSPPSEPSHPLFLEGIIEGFLFKREIDWTASVHRNALEMLKREYTKSISDQKQKFKEISQENEILKDQISEVLNVKTELLNNLHASQDAEFRGIIQTHDANIKALENTYDQKLALWKPVEYWEARGRSHHKKTIKFAFAAGVVGVVILGALGWLAYEIFLDVLPNEKPQVWQVGVFSVAAFFGIWVERILVRLFVSNIHLATDAEERVTMLQTYLSIIREGSEFAPEDKKLILERLFHPASDGLVKDDGAPSSPLEMLSRGK